MLNPRLAAALLVLALSATSSFATTFTVNKLTDDDGPCTPTDCSVREALIAARESPGPHVVELPPGRHLLSIPGAEEFGSFAGDLNINLISVELRGSPGGGTLIDAQGIDRPLTISNTTAVIRDITFTGGLAPFAGGLFFSFADVTVIRCAVVGNTGGSGGGIFSSSSVLTLRDSLVAGNSALASGGGMAIGGEEEMTTIVNSTFSGNSSVGSGGAIQNFSPARLTIAQSTFRNNTSGGGTLFHLGATNTVLVNNLIDGNCIFDQNSTPLTLGGNFESPGDTCRLTGFDFVNVPDLGLEPLAANGGPTQTHALLPSSPAVDAALSCTEPADQRGVARPADGNGDGEALCDSGAFELAPGQGFGGVEVPTAGATGLAVLASLLAAFACLRLNRR